MMRNVTQQKFVHLHEPGSVHISRISPCDQLSEGLSLCRELKQRKVEVLSLWSSRIGERSL